MSANVRITRANARSFAQISFDRTLPETLGEELFDVRRIARILSPAAKKINAGIDVSDIRNLRREKGEIVILVRNTAQHAKLRQMLPRLQQLLQEAGYRDTLKLRINPAPQSVVLRRNTPSGAPRLASRQSIDIIRKKAESMQPSALKDALEALARTMDKARNDR